MGVPNWRNGREEYYDGDGDDNGDGDDSDKGDRPWEDSASLLDKTDVIYTQEGLPVVCDGVINLVTNRFIQKGRGYVRRSFRNITAENPYLELALRKLNGYLFPFVKEKYGAQIVASLAGIVTYETLRRTSRKLKEEEIDQFIRVSLGEPINPNRLKERYTLSNLPLVDRGFVNPIYLEFSLCPKELYEGTTELMRDNYKLLDGLEEFASGMGFENFSSTKKFGLYSLVKHGSVFIYECLSEQSLKNQLKPGVD